MTPAQFLPASSHEQDSLLQETEAALAQVVNACDRVRTLAATATAFFRIRDTDRGTALMERADSVEVRGTHLRSAAGLRPVNRMDCRRRL